MTTVEKMADGGAAALIIAAIMAWVPPIAAFLGIVWYLLQIWESHTVRAWVKRRQARRQAKRRALLLRRVREISQELGETVQVKVAPAAPVQE